MNMTEIDTIETRIPAGMQLELNQIQRDFLVARARRDRSAYIASVIRKLARGLWQVFVPARRDAALKAGAALRQQHQQARIGQESSSVQAG